MRDHKCKNCEKLLLKGDLIDLEIKCPRCGTFNNIKYFSQAYLLTAPKEVDRILSR